MQSKKREAKPEQDDDVIAVVVEMENAYVWETQLLQENLVSESLLNRAGLKIVLKGDKVVLTKNGEFVGFPTESWAKLPTNSRKDMHQIFPIESLRMLG
ncbi:ty1-copia retrotransposon protein [Cucumis melo var. makuwa]|uniref:Ty1-copia retrotransposon protein n=1 Tax=Cucumis melo var. makuwa TaxID=1194695 RepID=A0A5D3C8V3_CUCMM|nr:ty1-copia retrotransposon protein [Cucumis melo var. makuwa]TYK07608.1 ty1-copia retrotransposon protein [Cucumis melo var. makuwa]